MLSEPGDGFYVQMVCWFVEQKQVEIGDEQPGQTCASLLPARQWCNLAFENRLIVTAEKCSENFSDAAVCCPFMCCAITEYKVANRFVLTALILLRENSDAHTAAAGDPSTVSAFNSSHDAEQCAFTTTVTSDYANPFALCNAERNILQHGIFAVRLRNGFKIYQITRCHINDFQ